jgi:hypothetical protein
MPKYAQVDGGLVVAFYDTDRDEYPNLPPLDALTVLSEDDWDLRATGSRWTIADGRLVAAPMSLELAASAALQQRLALGLTVTSTGNPAISGTYALDATTLDQVGAVARDFGSGLGLPGGGGAFYYPDKSALLHAFTGAEIIAVYRAMRDLLLTLNTQAAAMRFGASPDWPSQSVTLP